MNGSPRIPIAPSWKSASMPAGGSAITVTRRCWKRSWPTYTRRPAPPARSWRHATGRCSRLAAPDAADALWFPLLDYSPDTLGFFGPRTGAGDQRLGDWILSYGELTIHGAQPLPAPLSSPSLIALNPGATHRVVREGPDTSVGL